MQMLNVLLYGFDELGLILLYGTTNLMKQISNVRNLAENSHLWTNEQRVKLRKHAEHLISVTSRSKAISQARDYLVLDSRDPLVVRIFGRDPDFGPVF